MGEKKKEFTLKTLFEERKSLSPKQVVNKFDEWAMNGKYEEDMVAIRCRGPELVSQTVKEFYSSASGGNTDFTSLKILDVAGGTGLVAAELKKGGFKNIDGVDPSLQMLNIAKRRNLYDNVFIDYVDGHRLAIETDSYDCAVVSGGFSLGLMPTNALFEIVRLVKPGGVICIEMLEKNVHTVPEFIERLEPLCEEFRKKGVWEQLKKDVVREVTIGNAGGVICIEMIQSNLVRVEEFVNRFEPLWDIFISVGVWETVRKDVVPELVKGENGLLMISKVLVSEVPIPFLPPLNKKSE